MVVKCALVALVLPLRIPMEATVTKSKSEKKGKNRRNIKTKEWKINMNNQKSKFLWWSVHWFSPLRIPMEATVTKSKSGWNWTSKETSPLPQKLTRDQNFYENKLFTIHWRHVKLTVALKNDEETSTDTKKIIKMIKVIMVTKLINIHIQTYQ